MHAEFLLEEAFACAKSIMSQRAGYILPLPRKRCGLGDIFSKSVLHCVPIKDVFYSPSSFRAKSHIPGGALLQVDLVEKFAVNA